VVAAGSEQDGGGMISDGFPAQGLYDPCDEHDACGVGFMASIDGRPQRRVIDMAIEALGNLKHRGAVDADGKTGDGAGIMTQLPLDLLRREMDLPESGRIGIGQFFIPPQHVAAVKAVAENAAHSFGCAVQGWRAVPVDPSALGEKARTTLPAIWQMILHADKEEAAFETALYLTRRAIEKAGIEGLYICSMSGRTIVYKGLFLAEQTAVFYPDLLDAAYVSSFAIFHQRYSTNTAPAWAMAQPFRMIAHNGEINTLRGNLNWLTIHETRMSHPDFDAHLDIVTPVVAPGGSDSAALDSMFELMCRAGRPAPMVKSMLVPEAYLTDETMPQAHKDFYLYCNTVMEPWDGPAALAACDGRWLLGGMDRNGLRPFRYAITNDGMIAAGSEAGLIWLDDAAVIERGRIGPGQMIAVDLAEGKLYKDGPLKDMLAARQPFGEWVRKGTWFDSLMEQAKIHEEATLTSEELLRLQASVGQTQEDLDLILRPMAMEGKEAVGSMGDDCQLAALAPGYRPLHHFFRQNFAQVTNPPIDSLREKRVMSLYTRLGNLGNVLEEDKRQCQMLAVKTPILSNAEIGALQEFAADSLVEIDTTFPADGSESLEQALARVRAEAAKAVRQGAKHLLLTDRALSRERAALPAILAVAAAQTHLVRERLRSFVSLNIRTAECQDAHYFAVLIGTGATTVNPWMTQETIGEQVRRGIYGARELVECLAAYKTAIGDALLKIMSKMGIAVISSYRGGLNFEAVGFDEAMARDYFPGMPSRISGLGLSAIEAKVLAQHKRAYDPLASLLPAGGFYRYRASGETHGWEAQAISLLQQATANDDRDAYKNYSALIASQEPVTVRDLLNFRHPSSPRPLAGGGIEGGGIASLEASEGSSPSPSNSPSRKRAGENQESEGVEPVESVDSIRRRFITPAMSLGALSYEAHGTLNIAMNRIGARSNSGEGGEDPARYQRLPNGDSANSAIKQVASGRFGVTAEYLNQCREIEIKIAQGAKPGEGGQLPGFKVTEMIARFRHATPGVALISPPPHHDIYSIEDLAQLIYDLKQVSPDAKVCVKLVARSGIGTIAAGVAKAKADIIHIAGHAGGTGASPQTSLKFAGIPWEIGLAEVNQVLVLNDLRGRVTLRTDGGLKTGRDIVIAAMLGAEEFGIGTASLIALGCIMVRQCHSNTCPVGVCTQDQRLRAMYTGAPEKVIRLMTFLAEEVRDILASIGFAALDQVIGRVDLLEQTRAHNVLDLSRVLKPAGTACAVTTRTQAGRSEVADTLDADILRDAPDLLEHTKPVTLSYPVRNTHRSVGARLSSHIVRRFGAEGLPDGHITIAMKGSAGQSLGAFGAKGLKLVVEGEANDYVGKGLSGATIVVRPFATSKRAAHGDTIIGNTVLYGATSGRLFAAGMAGERFAVRNSGAEAVVEGCGSNGCEYMTGGTAIILGIVGPNFAAGMTGGVAFVYDPGDRMPVNVNADYVQLQRLADDDDKLLQLLNIHYSETGSERARLLLADWPAERAHFWQITSR
jgi:glutamate synthase (NADPH/NADH) large chain